MGSKKDYYQDIIDGYMERTAAIRKLSVPSISDASTADRYKELFEENARHIKPLLEENQRVFESDIMPVLSINHELTQEEVDFLNSFANHLQNNTGVEFLDISLLWRISDRLFEDAMAKDDVDYLVSQIDLRIIACSGKAIQGKCLNGTEDIWRYYQKKGDEAVQIMFPLLEKERFRTIESEETRESLVINSRYFCVVYEAPQQDPATNDMVIDRLVQSFEMSYDPDYTSLLPDYNWTRHRIKCLEYLGQLTERTNEQGITREQAKRILTYISRLKTLYVEDRKVTSEYISWSDIDLFITKNRYYAGEIDNNEYKKKLIYYYKNRNSGRLGEHYGNDYSTFINFQLPNEYIGSLDANRLTEEDIINIEYVYRSVIMDIYSMPNKDEFSAAMEYFARLLDHYIEVSGGITFKEFCLNFLAATLPQTFIHLQSVAELTRCITGYLIERRPELFLGMEGCSNVEQVQNRRRDIMAYAYNAGLIHDIGKVGLLPVLCVVERPTFPEDEELMYRCALSGRTMAKRAVSTSPYINIIAGRAETYDSTYPQEDGYNSWNVPQKAIVDILFLTSDMDEMADNMEKMGKRASIKDFMSVIQKGKGSTYAPYLENILSVPEVQRDMDFLLNEGREDIYRRTYVILKGVTDRGRV